MRLSDLEEVSLGAYGPEDYSRIKTQQDKALEARKKKLDRITRERDQLKRAQQKVQQQRSDVTRAASV